MDAGMLAGHRGLGEIQLAGLAEKCGVFVKERPAFNRIVYSFLDEMARKMWGGS